MAIERLANANNSLRRLGCCWQATFFILEFLLLVAAAVFALLAFEDRMGTRIQRGENYLLSAELRKRDCIAHILQLLSSWVPPPATTSSSRCGRTCFSALRRARSPSSSSSRPPSKST